MLFSDLLRRCGKIANLRLYFTSPAWFFYGSWPCKVILLIKFAPLSTWLSSGSESSLIVWRYYSLIFSISLLLRYSFISRIVQIALSCFSKLTMSVSTARSFLPFFNSLYLLALGLRQLQMQHSNFTTRFIKQLHSPSISIGLSFSSCSSLLPSTCRSWAPSSVLYNFWTKKLSKV